MKHAPSCRRESQAPALSRRAFLRLARLATAAAILAGCGQPAPTVEKTTVIEGNVTLASASRRGGTLIVGMAATSIVTLDPAAYSDRATETVIRNIFDGLMTWISDNEVIPELASGYRWMDSRTIEFDLKQGVQFHNGEDQ